MISMQKFFDIVLDMVTAAGFLKTSYIDRGDPADHDFTLTDFTTDSNWQDLDLSAIVPEHAKAVTMTLRIRAEEIGKIGQFRKKGNSHNFNISRLDNQISHIFITGDIIVAVDTDRKIQYAFSDVTWETIYLTVKGWWL